MQVLNSKKQSDLSHYLGFMVQKACLHLRLGQTGHVADIVASLFDIINDKKTVGIEDVEIPLTYQKPTNLFNFDDEAAVSFFTTQQ